jgi:hypothetical protein
MEEYVSDNACVVATFGIFAALRDSYTALVRGIGDWLPRVVIYEDWDMHPQDQYELWTSLGLKPQLIETLLTLQMRFSGGEAARRQGDGARAAERVFDDCLLGVYLGISRMDGQPMGFHGKLEPSDGSIALVRHRLASCDVATIQPNQRVLHQGVHEHHRSAPTSLRGGRLVKPFK